MTQENIKLPAVSLKRNFSWTLVGNIFYGLSQWMMLIIIAKIGTPEMVGRFALAFAITAPFTMCANLNLRAVQATDAKNEYTFADYLLLRIISQLVAFSLIIVFILISTYSTEVRILIIVIALAKIFEAISDILFGYLQKHECMDSISKSLILKGLMSLFGLSAGLYFTHSLIWGSAGLAITWLSVLVLYDIPKTYKTIQKLHGIESSDVTLKNQTRVTFNKPAVKSLALLSLPLGITTLLTSLMNNIPRYFVESVLGERALGIFAAMAYVIFVGIRVVTALGESASPRLSKYYALNEFHSYRKLLNKMLLIGIVLGIAGFIAASVGGKTILTILYRQEYAEFNNVFIFLMFAAGIMYVAILLEYGMNSARNFRKQPYIIGMSLVAVTVSCSYLIPGFGLLGASIAIAIGYAIQLVIYYIIINRFSSTI